MTARTLKTPFALPRMTSSASVSFPRYTPENHCDLHFVADRQFCINPFTKHAQGSIVLTRPPPAVGSLSVRSNQVSVDQPLCMFHTPSEHWRFRCQLQASRFLQLREHCPQLTVQGPLHISNTSLTLGVSSRCCSHRQSSNRLAKVLGNHLQ